MGSCGILNDIATVAQLSGLHAIMLITLAVRLLRILHCDDECAKLEECVQKLDSLLQWRPVPAGRDAPTQLPAMATRALVEAADLVGLYRRSTFWCRVWTGRSMEARLRGMQDRVNGLCVLVLCVHANLLTYHPASDTDATVISDPIHGAETSDSSEDSLSYNVTDHGGAEDLMDLNGDDHKVNIETIYCSAMGLLSNDDKKLPPGFKYASPTETQALACIILTLGSGLPDTGDKLKKQIHELNGRLTVIELSAASSSGASDEVICLDDQ